MPLIFGILLTILVLCLTWLAYLHVWGTPPSINMAVERLSLQMLLSDPELFTTLGLLDNTLLDFHSGDLTDASKKYMADRCHRDRQGLALIRRYQPERLTGQKRITYQLMRWYFEKNLGGHRFDYHWVVNPVFMGPYPVNHVFGVQVDLIHFLSSYHKIMGRHSARRYIRRLQKVPWKFIGLQESLQARAVNGVLPPRFVLEKAIAQIEEFLTHDINDNPLFTSFVERAAGTGRFSHRAAVRWGKKVQQVIKTDVLPAYQGLKIILQEQLDTATDDDGVWKLPDGKAYYAFLLRNHTTLELTAEDIHQSGLAEVECIEKEIRELMEQLELPTELPGLALKNLMADPQHLYRDEDQHQAILNDYQTILDEVNRCLSDLFSHGSLDAIVVKRLPEYKEPDSPIAYAQAPALDGSRPGTMWINLRDPKNIYRWGMRTLAYHEGIPGHVYQMAQAQKIEGLPMFRRTYGFNAYLEGWALYAERLGWQLDLGDRLSNLGRLQALLWRAVRLVVDTGIHDRQWTREEAIDYMAEKTGLPARDVITEVERYIVMPGQACAYYLGYLKVLALRRKAEATLGPSFDLKAFHDVLLNNGSLPLTLLETVVNDYVDRAAGLKLPAA